MSQEEKRRASKKAPRTQIEDLAPPVEELAEEEASLAAGGIHGWAGWRPTATREANSCTVGNALQGSDTDYADDWT